MRRSFRSHRRLAAVGAAAGLAILAFVGTASAPAATHGTASLTAAHKCLVLEGSGDPAFVKNFNPYVAGGGNLPSGAVINGAFYEPLIIVGEGGLKPVPWLARTWAWSNGNKTLTLNLAHGVKWSDGKPL
ncbi:MAG TPA: ABC transporter substrate-binding protein, partial [Gaiellaceae bacterium]